VDQSWGQSFFLSSNWYVLVSKYAVQLMEGSIEIFMWLYSPTTSTSIYMYNSFLFDGTCRCELGFSFCHLNPRFSLLHFGSDCCFGFGHQDLSAAAVVPACP
jgi:hypothetical protein